MLNAQAYPSNSVLSSNENVSPFSSDVPQARRLQWTRIQQFFPLLSSLDLLLFQVFHFEGQDSLGWERLGELENKGQAVTESIIRTVSVLHAPTLGLPWFLACSALEISHFTPEIPLKQCLL